MAIPIGSKSGGPVYNPPPRSAKPTRNAPQPVPRLPSPLAISNQSFASPGITGTNLFSNMVGQQLGITPEIQPNPGIYQPGTSRRRGYDLYGDRVGLPEGPGDVVERFLGGFAGSFDPRNVPKIPAGIVYAAQHPGEAAKQAFTTPEGLGGLAAGGVTAPLGGAALMPFKTNFRLPKSASAGSRVKDYPMIDSNYWRIKNMKMGEHGGFGGRFGNPADREIVARQRMAPTVEEHIAQLDALQGAQQGAVPNALRNMFIQEAMYGPERLSEMVNYKARGRGDRRVADVFAREHAQRNYPELMGGRPTISHGAGMQLGRELGELDDQFDPVDDVMPFPPAWQEAGVPITESLVKRQGLNQARRRGSFMDESRPMNAEGLADLLSRRGFWGGM